MKKDNLTEEQNEVFVDLMKHLHSNSSQIQLLIGQAGTGKTFLLASLVEEISKQYTKGVGVCSPTHKASKVIAQELNADSNVAIGTVHSFLNLKPKMDNNGVITYVRDKNVKWNKIKKLNILFIDEVPMLSDELFHHLIVEQQRGLKLIFVGDQNQIPPVGKLDAIPLLTQQQKEYDIKIYTLTTIIRQKKNNTIIKLANYVKQNLNETNFNVDDLIEQFDLKQNVMSIKHDDYDVQLKVFTELFKTHHFKNDTNHCKMLCWTNESVDVYNSIIRGIIYDENDLPRIMNSDKIIMNAPYTNKVNGKNKLVAKNNDELTIESHTIETDANSMYGGELKYYDILATTEANEEIELKVLHEDSQKKYDQLLWKISNTAKNQKNLDKRRMDWVSFYGLKNKYADIKYNYAVSVHKAQGSSYKNTIVHFPNIMLNKRIRERNRIFYTSITRSTDKLLIIV